MAAATATTSREKYSELGTTQWCRPERIQASDDLQKYIRHLQRTETQSDTTRRLYFDILQWDKFFGRDPVAEESYSDGDRDLITWVGHKKSVDLITRIEADGPDSDLAKHFRLLVYYCDFNPHGNLTVVLRLLDQINELAASCRWSTRHSWFLESEKTDAMFDLVKRALTACETLNQQKIFIKALLNSQDYFDVYESFVSNFLCYPSDGPLTLSGPYKGALRQGILNRFLFICDEINPEFALFAYQYLLESYTNKLFCRLLAESLPIMTDAINSLATNAESESAAPMIRRAALDSIRAHCETALFDPRESEMRPVWLKPLYYLSKMTTDEALSSITNALTRTFFIRFRTEISTYVRRHNLAGDWRIFEDNERDKGYHDWIRGMLSSTEPIYHHSGLALPSLQALRDGSKATEPSMATP